MVAIPLDVAALLLVQTKLGLDLLEDLVVCQLAGHDQILEHLSSRRFLFAGLGRFCSGLCCLDHWLCNLGRLHWCRLLSSGFGRWLFSRDLLLGGSHFELLFTDVDNLAKVLHGLLCCPKGLAVVHEELTCLLSGVSFHRREPLVE